MLEGRVASGDLTVGPTVGSGPAPSAGSSKLMVYRRTFGRIARTPLLHSPSFGRKT